MADRKLLILTYHFPPSAASGTYRMLGFARHLPQFSWQCVVVAPPRTPWDPTDEGLSRRVPPDTAVYHVHYPNGLLWRPIRRFLPFDIWLPLAAARCYRAIRERQPDAVLTSGPPHGIHLLGRHLHRRTGLPWVADFRDPWAAGDRSPMTWTVSSRDEKNELSVMSEANAIVANTPGARDLLCKAYPQFAAKMMSITNGYDPEAFDTNPMPPLSGSTIEITHTGEIYANRSPVPFLEAVGQLEAAALGGRRVRVRFIGNFADKGQKDVIDDKIRKGLNASISMEVQVPFLESVKAMVQADILLLLDSPGRRTGVPAKLYEYIGAGRPILALAEPESDVAWVLGESGLPHRIAPPLDTGAIRRALTELLQDPATGRVSERHRPLPTQFTRRNLAGDLSAVLNSCVERSSLIVGDRLLSASPRRISASRCVEEGGDLGGYQ